MQGKRVRKSGVKMATRLKYVGLIINRGAYGDNSQEQKTVDTVCVMTLLDLFENNRR